MFFVYKKNTLRDTYSIRNMYIKLLFSRMHIKKILIYLNVDEVLK